MVVTVRMVLTSLWLAGMVSYVDVEQNHRATAAAQAPTEDKNIIKFR